MDTTAPPTGDAGRLEAWITAKLTGPERLEQDQRRALIGALYQLRRKPHGGNNGDQQAASGQRGHMARTADAIGADFGASGRSVRRWADRLYQVGVDLDFEPELTDAAAAILDGRASFFAARMVRQTKAPTGPIPKKISDPAAVARRGGRPGIVTVQIHKTPEGVMRFVRKHLSRQDSAVLAERLAQYLNDG